MNRSHILSVIRMFVAVLIVGASALAAADQHQRVLMVVTNHDTLGDTGKPTGLWLAEVAHPWAHFVDAGIEVTFASPDGGHAPIDPRSFDLSDETNRRFWEDLEAVEALATTTDLGEIDPAKYGAIYFAGGHGTMWDFPDDPAVELVTRAIWESGGIVSAVCHGPAALVDVKLSDGEYLVAGKTVTGFSNSEEEAVGLKDAVPFLLVDRLQSRGAEVSVADDWQTHVISSGRLITGQNPGSAGEAAQRIVTAMVGETTGADEE